MTKRSGLDMRCFVAGYDLSGDINSFGSIQGGMEPLDGTDITMSANGRMGGRRSGSVQFVAFFEDTAGHAHPRLGALPTGQQDVMGLVGRSIGGASFCMRSRQVNYDGSRDAEGSFLFTVDFQSDGFGLEWTEQLTAGRRTESTATNGASLDGLASSALGWQAYLQVFALASGTPTIKLQDSADDSAWADLSGGGFGVIAANSTARIAGGATDTIRRYVRVATTGTFTGLDFAVGLARNLTAVTL